MSDLVTVEVDGVQFQVLPRQAILIFKMRDAIQRLASGVSTEGSFVEVAADGSWGSHFSIKDDGGYDRLAEANELVAKELRKRSLLFQGSAPITNRSTARN